MDEWESCQRDISNLWIVPQRGAGSYSELEEKLPGDYRLFATSVSYSPQRHGGHRENAEKRRRRECSSVTHISSSLCVSLWPPCLCGEWVFLYWNTKSQLL